MKFSERIYLPGFERMPLYDVAKFFVKALRQDALNEKAAAIAFNLFLAVFPTIVLFFTVISYIPVENFEATLFQQLESIMPEQTYNITITTIEDIVQQQRGGLLSISFLMVLFFSTQGVVAMMTSFNNTIYITETRPWFKQRILALVIVGIESLLALVITALMIVSHVVQTYFESLLFIPNKLIYYFFSGGHWVIIIALYFFGFSFLYYFGPAVKSRFRLISPGATLATILSVLFSFGFNIYIDHFSQFNILYGSLGTLILTLLWIFFHALMLLIGFELNISIRAVRRTKTP
ncbi:MAG: YihY/virulence factor BrkB family protein [bacterium]